MSTLLLFQQQHSAESFTDCLDHRGYIEGENPAAAAGFCILDSEFCCCRRCCTVWCSATVCLPSFSGTVSCSGGTSWRSTLLLLLLDRFQYLCWPGLRERETETETVLQSQRQQSCACARQQQQQSTLSGDFFLLIAPLSLSRRWNPSQEQKKKEKAFGLGFELGRQSAACVSALPLSPIPFHSGVCEGLRTATTTTTTPPRRPRCPKLLVYYVCSAPAPAPLQIAGESQPSTR